MMMAAAISANTNPDEIRRERTLLLCRGTLRVRSRLSSACAVHGAPESLRNVLQDVASAALFRKTLPNCFFCRLAFGAGSEGSERLPRFREPRHNQQVRPSRPRGARRPTKRKGVASRPGAARSPGERFVQSSSPHSQKASSNRYVVLLTCGHGELPRTRVFSDSCSHLTPPCVRVTFAD